MSGLRDAPARETITIGWPDANNHRPSISGVSIAWIESPAADISGVGAVMLQRLGMGAVGKTIDLATLAVAKRTEILVTDDAAVGSEAGIAALGDGIVAACVDADDGVLVVKTYAGDGAQIGQAEVDPGDDGAIGEFALASSGGDELAVAYVQLRGAAGACAVDYGNKLLQRNCVTTLGDAACLVELGRDGDRDGIDVAAQLTMEGGDLSVSDLAVGRAPAAIGAGEGGLAVARVEKDGARAVKGVISISMGPRCSLSTSRACLERPGSPRVPNRCC